MEDYVPLMHIPRNRNSNIDDLEINLYMRSFHGAFSQLDSGNETMKLGLKNSVDMYTYRNPLFEMIQIGMSMMYSVFASECYNANVL